MTAVLDPQMHNQEVQQSARNGTLRQSSTISTTARTRIVARPKLCDVMIRNRVAAKLVCVVVVVVVNDRMGPPATLSRARDCSNSSSTLGRLYDSILRFFALGVCRHVLLPTTTIDIDQAYDDDTPRWLRRRMRQSCPRERILL
jgi:hypothetical protein